MRRFLFVLLLTVVLGVTQHATVLAQSAPDTAVKAVLFYSPTCPHCHTVINDTLLPLMDQYGDRLVVIGIDITQPGGQTLYNASTAQFQISDERLGVPRLIVGETVLIGSLEIPQQLPSIIETGLSNGGIDWPDIPGLVEAMAAGQQAEQEAAATDTPSTAPEPTAVVTEPPSPTATSTPDVVAITTDSLPPAGASATSGLPEGGWLAALILGAMLLVLAYAAIRVYAARGSLFASNSEAGAMITSLLVPGLALIGLVVSGYLAYVEITQTSAVCGPVGECNVVQSSAYAQIFGIPVAVLGIANYLAILGLWLVHRMAAAKLQRWTGWALLLLTVFGVLFSVYLTLLELFVINAVCIWCLSSAIITTSLLLVVVLQMTRQSRIDPPKRQQQPLHA